MPSAACPCAFARETNNLKDLLHHATFAPAVFTVSGGSQLSPEAGGGARSVWTLLVDGYKQNGKKQYPNMFYIMASHSLISVDEGPFCDLHHG